MDTSAEGIIMRAGQPFAMRYPLIEVEGNGGSPIESGNWAAMRYTSARLSEFSNYLFTDIKKIRLRNGATIMMTHNSIPQFCLQRDFII